MRTSSLSVSELIETGLNFKKSMLLKSPKLYWSFYRFSLSYNYIFKIFIWVRDLAQDFKISKNFCAKMRTQKYFVAGYLAETILLMLIIYFGQIKNLIYFYMM